MDKEITKSNKIPAKTKEVFNADKIGKLLTDLSGDVKQINTRIDSLDKQINTRINGLNKNVEQVDGTINRLIDSQLKLDEKIDVLDEKLSGKIDDLDNRVFSVEKQMDSMEGRMCSMENRMDSMELEIKSSFKTVVAYLNSIEDEIAEVKTALAEKPGKKDLETLEQRIFRLEIELDECKKQIAAAKK